MRLKLLVNKYTHTWVFVGLFFDKMGFCGPFFIKFYKTNSYVKLRKFF